MIDVRELDQDVSVSTGIASGVWDDVVAADAHAMPSQTRQWVDAAVATEGLVDCSRLYTFSDGSQVVVPLVASRRRPAALRTIGTMPEGWGFGGLVSSTPVTDHRYRVIWDDLISLPATRVRIRPNPLTAVMWERTAPIGVVRLARRAHVLDLSGGFDTVWSQRVKPIARSNVRRGERHDVEVTCGASDRNIEAYRTMLLSSRERWSGKQHEPRRFGQWRAERRDPFERIVGMLRHAPDVSRLWVAWYRGEPAAGIVVALGRNAHYTRGAMDRALAGETRANDVLQRAAIEDACRHGCRSYHMGESGSSQSLAHFKERFGAQPHDYTEFLIERWPRHRVETAARRLAKRAIGFRDD